MEATVGFPDFGRYEENVIRTRHGDVLAIINHMFGGYPTARFLTVFTGGGAILTANYERTREEEDDYLAQGEQAEPARLPHGWACGSRMV